MGMKKQQPMAIVTVTATSSTLDELLVAAGKDALTDDLDGIQLIPFANGIYMNDGAAATTSSVPLGVTSWVFPFKKEDVATMEFLADNVKMAVIPFVNCPNRAW